MCIVGSQFRLKRGLAGFHHTLHDDMKAWSNSFGLLIVCFAFQILNFDQHGADDRRFRIAVKLLCPFHKFFKSIIPNIP